MERSGIGGLEGQRVGICLSSGFFGYYAHCGFMQAVTSLGLRPAAITGCSAGAILGALWASGLDHGKIREALTAVRLRDLLDPPGLGELLGRPFGLTSGRRLEALLERILPVARFEDCPIPFSVTVFDLNEGALRAVETGPIARAVRASASLPGLFCPTLVEGHLCWDGALAEKAPLGPLGRRGDLDAILVCYLARPQDYGPPRSLVAGLRLALDSLVYASDRRALDELRASGARVHVVAPRVPRCGPHLLGEGSRIIDVAEQESLRILSRGDFGCQELS